MKIGFQIEDRHMPIATPVMTVDELTRALLGTPGALRSLVRAQSDDALTFRDSPDSWNVIEVLCHVTDGEVHDWWPRLQLILAGGEQPFDPFDRTAGFAIYRGWSTVALLDEFDRLRHENIRRVHALHLEPADWARTGIHPEFGRVTLAELMACWVTHDLAHVAQIARVLTRFHGRGVGPWRKYFSLLSPNA